MISNQRRVLCYECLIRNHVRLFITKIWLRQVIKSRNQLFFISPMLTRLKLLAIEKHRQRKLSLHLNFLDKYNPLKLLTEKSKYFSTINLDFCPIKHFNGETKLHVNFPYWKDYWDNKIYSLFSLWTVTPTDCSNAVL
jgi:hypothetical protein